MSRRQSDKEGQRITTGARRGVAEFDINYLINVIVSRYKPILGVFLLSLLLGALFLSFQTKLYSATTMIQLHVNERPLVDTDTLTLGKMDDSAAVQSELDILKSPALIRRVVEKLNLQSKPEFNTDLQPRTFIWGVKQWIHGFFKSSLETAATEDEQKEIALIKVSGEVMKRISLNKNPLSYTVNISFTSLSASRARVIADAIADEYLAYQIDADNDSSRHAREWYMKRVGELRENLIASEQAVQQFSQDHNLFELDGKTPDDQQYSELNAQIGQARAEQAQAEARLERAQELVKTPGGVESAKEVLDSVLIQSLREKEAELMREKSEAAGHYGPAHPKIVQINGELADLRGKIDIEIKKIIAGMENDVAIAKARVISLGKELETMRPTLGDKTRVQLTELKRQADANRAMYESLLSRAKETGEAENGDQATARIISRADLPLLPAYPKKGLIMALFALAGLFCGMALAFLMELMNLGFDSSEQIESLLGVVTIGMAPEIATPGDSSSYAAQTLAPVYTEALRTIMASLHFADMVNPPRSLLIISALPQEGKGWLAVSLARIAAQSGKRILLLDCDLHRPLVSDIFEGGTKETLNTYLSGECEIRDIINVDSSTGMHYIASAPHRGNVQELLESERMKNLMEAAHKAYDLVIMDSPPVVGLPDVFFLSRLADTAVLAVRWRKTPRRIVSNAMRVLGRAHTKLAGVVLMRVDMEHYKKSQFGGRHIYQQYGGYYHDVEQPARGEFKENIKSKIIKFRARQ